jgi:transposase
LLKPSLHLNESESPNILSAMVKDTDPRAIIEQMKSYSEVLRKKIVAAVERGTSKSETARLFGVGLSSVKRYVGMASSGESLAPKKRSGRATKADETTKRLLNEDMKERPVATIAERIRFLESITGKRLSYSTVWRLLKRLGWSRKKVRWGRRSEMSG